MDPDGVDGEEERAHDGEAPREPVHVVEEVEGVRDRHEPQEAEGGGGEAVVDDLDADARREDDSRGGELPGELHGRRQGAEVVDQAEGEHDRRAAGDARELPRRLDRAGEQARADARQEAEEDADAAERRRVLRVPAVVGGAAMKRPPRPLRSSAQIVRAATGKATIAATALMAETVVRAC